MDLKKIVAWVFMMIMVVTSTMAQDIVTRKSMNKKWKKTYRKGLNAMRANEYDEAVKQFDKILKKEPNFVELYLRKGSIYYMTNELEKSKENFLHAISIAPEFDKEMYYSAGQVLMKKEEFDQAAYHLEAYLDRDPENARKLKKAKSLLRIAKFSHEAINNPVPFDPFMLPESINTSESEYNPMLSIDGSQLVFTRRVGGQEDFYESEIDTSGNYSIATEVSMLNTPINEGAHTLSADGNFMVFTACDRRDSKGGCDLYYSRKKNGEWIEPINMGPVINTPAWESQPSLSADGQMLYFTSNRKGGKGGKDIWVSLRAGDNNGWTKPINLDAPINTAGNEESPFIHADGLTLYFRSDYHPGMGGFDLFLSQRGINAISWSAPKNLGYPINSSGDEGALTVSLDGEHAYFASDKAYGKDDPNANLDIYSFELHDAIRPRKTTYLKVQIVDALTQQPLSDNNLILTDGATGDTIQQLSKVADTWMTSLPAGQSYGLAVEREAYVFQSRYFDLVDPSDKLTPYDLKIEMIPLPKTDTPEVVFDKPVVLNNIFFETGSAVLLDISLVEINRLAQMLRDQPDLQIHIIGHTDNVGSDADNMKLSKDRAQSVYQALVEAGVSSQRMSFEGKGETEPIADNDTEDGRRANRRTEFLLKK